MSVNPEAAEWPSHVEELSRKLNQQLERRVNAHTRGVINDKELYLLVDFAWDITSGLVFESDSRTLETLHAALRTALKGVKKNG